MPSDIETILKIEVPVIVQIAERWMPVEDVMNISPGAILELPKRADDDLDILVNNIQVGVGNAVKVGENFGIRVTNIGDVQQRVEALGGEKSESAENDTYGGGEGGGGAEMSDEEAAALAEQMLNDQSGG